MKKFIFTFLLVFSITCGAIFAGFLQTGKCGMCSQARASTNQQFNADLTSNDDAPVARTIFMVNPTAITNTTKGTYIYDKSDNCLKLITQDVAGRKSYQLPDLGTVKDMCAVGEDIYLLTDNDNNLYKVTINQLDGTINSQTISLNGYSVTYRDKISCSMVNGSPVIVIFSSTYDASDTETHPIYAMQSSSGFTFANIKLNGDEMVDTNKIPINDIVIVGTATSAWAIISPHTRSVGTVTLNMTDNLISGEQIGVYIPNLFGENLQLSDVKHLSLAANQTDDQPPMLYVAGSTGLCTYSLDTTTDNLTSSKISSNNYNFTEQMVDFGVSNDGPVVLVDNGYYLLNNTNNFVPVNNPVCVVTARTPENFEYYQLTTDTKLINSPSSTHSTVLSSGSFVVEIADITLQDNGNSLGGYKYVVVYMQTEDGTYKNEYGYIEIQDNLTKIEQTPTTDVVKVADGTYLFSLPSDAQDATNTKTTINGRMPVNVLIKIKQYHTTSSNSLGEEIPVYYALVQVGGRVGFIDVARQITKDERTLLIIPNAKLTHNATVWLNADTNSDVMHNLEAGTKVRIIGSRDKNGFVLVKYNDQYGNEFEGYMLATRVQSYSYTTLQIIGSVLVALNIVFLIVLVVTKRRIAR